MVGSRKTGRIKSIIYEFVGQRSDRCSAVDKRRRGRNDEWILGVSYGVEV
jgi:hypothetical protein